MKVPDGTHHNTGFSHYPLHLDAVYMFFCHGVEGVEWGNRPYPLRLPETCLLRNLRTEARSHSTNPVVISFGIPSCFLFLRKREGWEGKIRIGGMKGCLGIGVEDRTGVGGKLKGMFPSSTSFTHIQD